MQKIVNAAKERLAKGEIAIGMGIRGVRGVEIARLMKTAGFDWLFIDLEHGATSTETAYAISVAALDAGIAPFVRVPHGELAMGTRCLDAGALGVSISGAGPTAFALCGTPEAAGDVARAMCGAYEGAGVAAIARVARPDRAGARLVGDRQMHLTGDS